MSKQIKIGTRLTEKRKNKPSIVWEVTDLVIGPRAVKAVLTNKNLKTWEFKTINIHTLCNSHVWSDNWS